MRRQAIGLRQWRPTPRPALAGWQKSWLTRGGSLTQRLSTLGRVEVRVVRETVGMPWPDERRCMTPGLRGSVWIREVVLLVDGVPCVAAHSIAPLSASRGVWRAMRALGSRPLADLLFIDRSVSRSRLVSRPVGVGAPLYRFARGFAPALSAPLMARRSLFVRRGAPLLVTECMLPALWAAASVSCAVAASEPALRRRPARRAGATASSVVLATPRPHLGP